MQQPANRVIVTVIGEDKTQGDSVARLLEAMTCVCVRRGGRIPAPLQAFND